MFMPGVVASRKQAGGVAWDLTNAAYTSKVLDLSSTLTNMSDIYIRDDGIKLYVAAINDEEVRQYTMSTAWDITTATYDSKFKDTSNETNSIRGLFFSSDGTKMYASGNSTREVFQYSLSTAWDVSTATYDTVNYSINDDTTPIGIFFSSDGTKLYHVDSAADQGYQHNLSVAWDLSTAVYSTFKYFGNEDTSPTKLSISPDGLKMFVVGTTGDNVYQYTLSTAWILNTATYDSLLFSITPEEALPYGMHVKTDGTGFYIPGLVSKKIHQYSL